MKIIKYILVNETASQNVARLVYDSFVSDLRFCHVIDRAGLSRGELIDRLVRLRRHHPDAPILGLSEVDTSSAYAPIRVNPWMNQLRRELSDYP